MINIRPAKHDDIPGILSVFEQLSFKQLKGQDKTTIEQAGFLVHGFSPEQLQTFINDPEKSLVLVATEQGNIVGYLVLFDDLKANSSRLDDTQISDDIKQLIQSSKVMYHRHIASLQASKGIGKSLMHKAVSIVQQKGYQYLVCRIAEAPFFNKRSKAFHESIGFKRVGYGEIEDKVYGLYLLDINDCSLM